MKATINGVTVEGTPQEIAEYQRIVNGYKPYETVPHVPKPDWTYRPNITCSETKDYAWNGPVSELLREVYGPGVPRTISFGGERKDGF